MDFVQLIKELSVLASGWPLMIYTIGISLIYTIVLRGIQFKYLFTALKTAVCPSQKQGQQVGEVSPFHAFQNRFPSNCRHRTRLSH